MSRQRLVSLFWYPLWRIEGTNLIARTKLHLFETLQIYPSNRGPELGTFSKQRSFQRPVQGQHRLLVPVAKQPHYEAQDLLNLLLRSNTLFRTLEVRRGDKPLNPFFINAGNLQNKQGIVLLLVGGAHEQDIVLDQGKRPLPNRVQFSNVCKMTKRKASKLILELHHSLLTAVQSEGNIDDDPLPPSSQPVFNPECPCLGCSLPRSWTFLISLLWGTNLKALRKSK